MKKILIIVLCLIMVSISLVSCSRPPEYSEIEDRLKELIEASYEINEILFGDGLEVYEKVYEPEILLYRDASDRIYYYYVIEDEELGKIYAYRNTEVLYFTSSKTEKDGEEYVYLDENGNYYYQIDYNGSDMDKEVSSYEDKQSGKKYYFYVIEDETLGKVYEYRLQTVKYLVRSTEQKADEELIFEDKEKGHFYYYIDYKEKEYELYYTEDTPAGYSYVRVDEKYTSVEQIKEAAEKVYSKQYLEGIYEMLFTGAIVSDDASGSLGARYYNYTDENGTVWFMESDEYEPLIKEKRIYDLSTAKIVKPGNSGFANIEIETYLESSPENRVKVRLSIIKQDDGEWYLDTATY